MTTNIKIAPHTRQAREEESRAAAAREAGARERTEAAAARRELKVGGGRILTSLGFLCKQRLLQGGR